MGKELLPCRVNLKPMGGRDGLFQVTSDGEAYEDPDNEGGDDPLKEGDGDDDNGPPEGEEDDGEITVMVDSTKKRKKPPKTKKGSSQKRRSSHKKADAKEEEDEDDNEDEDYKEPLTPLEYSRQARYNQFMKDTEEANFVRGLLLNLRSDTVPTQAQVDESELFLEQPSDKSVPVPNISHVWMPILESKLWLTTEAPGKVEYKDGDAPMYKYEDLMALVPNAAGAWNATKEKEKPALVSVIPATTTLPLDEAVGLDLLHNVDALWKVTVPRAGGPKGKTDQFSFCGYCGVRVQNYETSCNHMRHHLHLQLLCRGCYGKAFTEKGHLSGHMRQCEAIKNATASKSKADPKRGGSLRK